MCVIPTSPLQAAPRASTATQALTSARWRRRRRRLRRIASSNRPKTLRCVLTLRKSFTCLVHLPARFLRSSTVHPIRDSLHTALSFTLALSTLGLREFRGPWRSGHHRLPRRRASHALNRTHVSSPEGTLLAISTRHPHAACTVVTRSAPPRHTPRTSGALAADARYKDVRGTGVLPRSVRIGFYVPGETAVKINNDTGRIHAVCTRTISPPAYLTRPQPT